MTPLDPIGELALVARCRSADQAAWAELYEAYSPSVLRFVRRCAGPNESAEDLVQQVFVEVFVALERYRGDARLTTWLYRIAARVVTRAQRTRQRREKRHRVFRSIADAFGYGVERPHEGRVEARRALGQLDGVLGSLSPKLRVVWVMVELEGMSPEEAAGALDIRAATARSRLCEARKRVVEGLMQCGLGSDGRPRLRVVQGRGGA